MQDMFDIFLLEGFNRQPAIKELKELKLRDIEACGVTNSLDALRKIEEQEFDVAVLDVRMPDIGGLDVLAFDWKTGELGREMRYLTCVTLGEDPELEISALEVDFVTEAEFQRRHGFAFDEAGTDLARQGTCCEPRRI